MPPPDSVPVMDDETGQKVSGGVDEGQPARGSQAKTNNPADNVGVTGIVPIWTSCVAGDADLSAGEDGGLSTEATVADGGAPAGEEDGECKPA